MRDRARHPDASSPLATVPRRRAMPIKAIPIVEPSWGVTMIDVTDSVPPHPDQVDENGWVLICFGEGDARPCPLDPHTSAGRHGIVAEYDPGLGAHRLFLDYFRTLLKPGVQLRLIPRQE
jgi:hypothetical protein